jgi:hypothetical protein
MGAQPETVLQNQIRLAVSSNCRDVVLFRNHSGALRDSKTGRMIPFGLSPGSPDLVGWKIVEITPDMVGMQVAVFCGIEIKTPTGRLRADQAHWLQRLDDSGGIAGVARSIDEALSLLTVRATMTSTD